jgi:serine/threonine-protein kinase RsbW
VTTPVVELAIPPRSVYVGVARLAIAALAREAGFDEEGVDDLKTAVSEACTNAVLSSEEAATNEPVVVTWIEDADRVVIEVCDRGSKYDATQIEGALDSQGFSLRLALSMSLLRSLADEMAFEPRDGGGMRVRLIMTRHR